MVIIGGGGQRRGKGYEKGASVFVRDVTVSCSNTSLG